MSHTWGYTGLVENHMEKDMEHVMEFRFMM